MNFEKSKYSKQIEHTKVVLPFGSFYFAEKVMIVEINEGYHFGWDEIEVLIPIIIDHYGEEVEIAYISNRVNSYSLEPQSWIKFEKNYNFIIAIAIVIYDDFSKMNASLEKLLTQKSLKRCYNLDAAIEWVLNLKEFNK